MMLAQTKIQLKGVGYEPHEIPFIYCGHRKPLAYVLNAKAACTMMLNVLFFANHGYAYLDPHKIHDSNFAFIRVGPNFAANSINAYNSLAPETFSIVRDPLQRFVSGFISKLFDKGDPNYAQLRDLVTSVHDVDLSADAKPAQSCLAFAKVIAAQQNINETDRHFRPQYLNLRVDDRFQIDTILRLEDHDAVLQFFSKWVGPQKARWFLTQRFGSVAGYERDAFISDDLVDLVRKIYARDYELFYS